MSKESVSCDRLVTCAGCVPGGSAFMSLIRKTWDHTLVEACGPGATCGPLGF